MPIACSVKVIPVDQERFHAVDKLVMREAFSIHNELGRFCDEAVYQAALAQRCRGAGFGVEQEVHVRVAHQGFVKPYYLDLVVENGIVYELKTVAALNGDHQRQLINYLLLTGLKHGKLLNFRPGSVEFRFVSTRLRREDRANLKWIEDGWDGDDEAGCRLRSAFAALVDDWGLFLDATLYRDALNHLLATDVPGGQPVDILDSGQVVGQQKMHLLDSITAWHLSAVGDHPDEYAVHLQRLLRHTRLARLLWINLHHTTITLKTLSNTPSSPPEE